MLQLPVPYRSQWDTDARRHIPDCGPTCIAMVLNFLGVEVTPDQLYDVTLYESPGKYTTIGELRKAGQASGVEFPFQPYASSQHEALEKLRVNLEEGRPLVALVDYEPWIGHTGISYGGGHFVVVTGYDEGAISFHDPLFSGLRREQGAHFTLPKDRFCAGWGGFATGENPNWAFLAPGVGGPIGEAGEGRETGEVGDAGEVSPAVAPETRRRIEAMAVFEGELPPDWTDEQAVATWLGRIGDWGTTYDEHTVAPGESLIALARHYYGEDWLWRVIQAYNGLQRDRLLINERLRIPHLDSTAVARARSRSFTLSPEDNLEELEQPAIDYDSLAPFSKGIGYESEYGVMPP